MKKLILMTCMMIGIIHSALASSDAPADLAKCYAWTVTLNLDGQTSKQDMASALKEITDLSPHVQFQTQWSADAPKATTYTITFGEGIDDYHYWISPDGIAEKEKLAQDFLYLGGTRIKCYDDGSTNGRGSLSN